MNEKPTSIVVERGEETFEFGEPTRLPDERVTVGVVNHAHDDPEEHVYSLFFEVDNDGDVRASRCSGPGYQYHGEEGTCKHCKAAEQCPELLSAVKGSTSTTELDDIPRVCDADGTEFRVEENTEDIVWLKRDDGQHEEDIWFADRDKFWTALEDGEFEIIDGGKKTIADGGECSLCKSLPGGAMCWSCVRDETEEGDR